MPTPFVSVVIPCRDEARFIERCLRSLAEQDYPQDRIEFLVVDGLSADGTREKVAELAAALPALRLLDNPKRTTPAAMNTGIRSARGEIIIRMDAHSEYPRSFVTESVRILEETGAAVVGGPVETVPGAPTLVARAIALATAHPFGVGNSAFRTASRDGFVDTVPFGTYRRPLFDEIGFFDERLPRNQDNELTSRVISSGRKIFLSQRLRVRYFNQATLGGLLRQAFRTGMWNIMTVRISPSALRLRHFIPAAFALFAILSCIIPFVSPALLRYAAPLWMLYGLCSITSSLWLAARNDWQSIAVLPWLFPIYHLAYGTGTLLGLLRLMSGTWEPSGPK